MLIMCLPVARTGVPGLESILHSAFCMRVRNAIISRAVLSNTVLSLDVMCFCSNHAVLISPPSLAPDL